MQKILNEAGKKYSVFEIVNQKRQSKNYGRKIYVATSYMTEEDILSRIRSIQDSKTGKGGTKDLAKDLRAAGKDYHEDFKVRLIKSGLDRERAEEIKAQHIDKSTKVYNQDMAVV
jgi:spore coat polysaccharide biosynthesis protein SpsF (cytidylyltransferase family)